MTIDFQILGPLQIVEDGVSLRLGGGTAYRLAARPNEIDARRFELAAAEARDAVIGECQAWIAQNYVCTNPVAAMTERSGLKPRTFARRFRSATGYLPIEYVHAVRIEEARMIIETEASGLDEVGNQVGYEDPTFFRRLFKRETGLSPATYRRRVAGILPAPNYDRSTARR